MTLDDTRFEQLASDTLDRLMEAIDDQVGDVVDVEMQNGVLTLKLESGGEYVINKHRPNRQVWMSSPKSGATRYDYDEVRETWVSTGSGERLLTMLGDELKAHTGERVAF